jgi:uncharacterized protein YjbJ (UPF0337 family)
MSGNTDEAAGMANKAAGKIKQRVGETVGWINFRAKALHSKQRATPSI